MTDTWTDDRTKSLISLWADGYSAKQIADRLELQSRSAVIGKIRRLDLPTPAKKLAFVRRVTSVRTKTLYQMLVDRPTDDLADKALHISFLDLEGHHCRFPYGLEGPYTFCGHPKTGGSSYCEGHRAFTCEIIPANRLERLAKVTA